MTSTRDQLPRSCVFDEEEHGTHVTNNEKQNPRSIVIPSRNDSLVHGHAKMIENMKHIKQYAGRILRHDRSTIEFKPDGSFLVTPHFPQVPNEVVTMIIHHLAHDQKSLFQCTLVATQFYSIANPLLWRVLDFRTIISFERFLVSIHHVAPTRLAKVGQHIQELRLCGPHCTDAHLSWPLTEKSLLQPVTFHPPTPTVEACLLPLLPHCRHLTTLELTFLPLGYLCFFTIGRNCVHLRDLEWHMCSTQTPEWLTMLRDCPLERLAVSSIHTPFTSNFTPILQLFDHLTDLQIFDKKSAFIKSLLAAPISKTAGSISDDNDRDQELYSISNDDSLDDDDDLDDDLGDDDDLHDDDLHDDDDDDNAGGDDDNDGDHDRKQGLKLALNTVGTALFWPRLTTLILDPCNYIDDRTLLCFLRMHTQLETLHLTNTKRLTDIALDGMAVLLPNLAHLTLILNRRISSSGVRRFVRRCTSLQTFRLYGGKVVLSDDNQAELVDTFHSSSSVALLNQWTMDWIRKRIDPWTMTWINETARENAPGQRL